MLIGHMSEIASNPAAWIRNLIIMLPGIVIGLSFHEFAHAYSSYKLGDPTPLNQGRVTISPTAHVDPVGLFCLIFAGFGWGIPVQINPLYYKHRRRDELIVALAGVVMNLFIAFCAMAALKAYVTLGGEFVFTDMGMGILQMIQEIVIINLVLMVFNLLPVPPLDGWNVIVQIFDLTKTEFYWKVYDKGIWILLILIIFNITGRILSPAVSGLYGMLTGIFF